MVDLESTEMTATSTAMINMLQARLPAGPSHHLMSPPYGSPGPPSAMLFPAAQQLGMSPACRRTLAKAAGPHALSLIHI